MEVRRYIYQSPYNAPVQFGRPDPTTQQKESDMELTKNGNETLKKAEALKMQLQNEASKSKSQESAAVSIQPRVLDIYA